MALYCIYCNLSCDTEVSKISIKIKNQLSILTDTLSYTLYSRCSDVIHIKILLVFSILILIRVSFSSMTLKYLIHMNFSNLLNTNPCKLYHIYIYICIYIYVCVYNIGLYHRAQSQFP